jgi:hypothetical protein
MPSITGYRRISDLGVVRESPSMMIVRASMHSELQIIIFGDCTLSWPAVSAATALSESRTHSYADVQSSGRSE